MSKSYPIIERDNGRVVVLARSAEEAHLAATDELGVSCVIESVERVRSGGLGGFFSTELVRLVAAAPTHRAAPQTPTTEAPFARAENLLRALPAGSDFAHRLQDELEQLRAQGTAAAEDVWRQGERSQFELGQPGSLGTSRPFTVTTGRITPTAADDALAAIPVRLPPEPEAEPSPRSAPESAPLVERDGEYFGLDADDPAPSWMMEDLDLPARFIEPEPDRQPALASSMAARSGIEACDVLDELGTSALLAQVVAAEFEPDERPITHRAQMIRSGAFTSPEPAVDPPAAGVSDVVVSHDSVTEPAPEELCNAEAVVVVEPNEPPPSIPATPPAAEVRADEIDVPDVDPPRSSASPTDGSEPTDDERFAAEPEAWSVPMLRAIGLPDRVVDDIADRSPVGDVEHLVAFMLSVQGLCAPLDDRPMVLTGPSSANLARQFDLSSQSGDQLETSTGSVASPNVTPDRLRRGVGDRAIHLVVGGHWHHLASIRPDVVSAATEHDLLEALRVAAAWGAPLGWTSTGERYVRIDPYLLAGRVRELLPTPSGSPSPSSV